MTIFKHPFIQFLRLERKLGIHHRSLKTLGVALGLAYQQGDFTLEDAYKLGYYLPASDFIALKNWALNKYIKFDFI